jgi:hypothetical protein
MKVHTAVSNIFFHIVLIELFVGSSGRLFAINFFSLRMFLFVISMIVVLCNIHKISSKYYLNLTFIFSLILIFNAFVGFLNNADSQLVWDDVRYLSYFPILLFFQISIDDIKKIKTVTNIIKFSSLVVSIIYVVVSLLLRSEIIDPHQFYESMSPYDGVDIAFRSEYVFIYTGFFASITGFFFFLFEGDPQAKSRKYNIFRFLSLSVIMYSVLITYTRWLLVSLFLPSIICYLYFNYKNRKLSSNVFFIVVIFAFVGVFGTDFILSFNENRSMIDESDTIRLITMEQSFSMLTPLSLLIGHGLGMGVSIRPFHMEIVYLEILHKQGLIGIIFYLFFFVKIISNFLRIFQNTNQDQQRQAYSTGFTAAALYVYIQSLTNPLLTNAFGISIVLLSLVVTDLLIELPSQSPKENTTEKYRKYIT